MNIFSEVKEYLTARQVAENYGLQVRRNGLACCPFHDDKHPSMKIDKNYHCFACGVGGDAIDYVSRMFGLSQYEAALKIVEDFRLPIEVKGNKELSEQDRARIRRERTERERLIHIRERFDRWCNHSIESLRDGLLLIEQMGIFLNGKPPDIIFSEDYARMLHAEPIMNYWLDILCMGSTEDKQELFMKGRKEVEEVAERVRIGRERGPPCQAYSMAGRGKLRSLGEDRVNVKDARGYLYQDFLRFAFELNARAVIMENVPESTNFGGKNIPEIVCEELTKKGYKAYWTLLNSADYGVPQVRERVFVVAIKNEEDVEIYLPQPTHRNTLDVMTQHQKRFEGYKQCKFFKEPNGMTDGLKPWVTVGDAFSDLPEVFPTADSKYKLVSLNIEYPYKTEAQNEYQTLMRSWYGREGFGVSANAFRKNTRDFPIFARMQQGDNYISASRIADELFYEESKLFGYEKDSEEYINLYNKMVPQYDRDKFENKWKKLDETKPSHTLVAHLGKDTYSHIHPWEPRGITVREAARLQSFPDDFFFDCSMGDAFKQIGNAVPPLLALGVAKSVFNTFEEE